MIFRGTYVKVIDNSGGLVARCIGIHRSLNFATVGDIISITLVKVNPHRKVKRKQLYRALVVRSVVNSSNFGNWYISFDSNAVVLLKPGETQMLGNRITSYVSADLKKKGYSRLLGLASRAFLFLLYSLIIKKMRLNSKKIFLFDEWNWSLREQSYIPFNKFAFRKICVSTTISVTDSFLLPKTLFLLKKLFFMCTFFVILQQRRAKKGHFVKFAKFNCEVSPRMFNIFYNFFFTSFYNFAKKKNIYVGANISDFNTIFIFRNLSEFPLVISNVYDFFEWPFFMEFNFYFYRFAPVCLSLFNLLYLFFFKLLAIYAAQ